MAAISNNLREAHPNLVAKLCMACPYLERTHYNGLQGSVRLLCLGIEGVKGLGALRRQRFRADWGLGSMVLSGFVSGKLRPSGSVVP